MASVCFSYPGQKNMLTWSSIHKNNCLRQDQFTVILIYINLVISEKNIFSNTIFYYGTTLLWYYVMALLIFMHILNPTWKPSNKNSHPRLLFKLRQNTSTCCLSNMTLLLNSSHYILHLLGNEHGGDQFQQSQGKNLPMTTKGVSRVLANL